MNRRLRAAERIDLGRLARLHALCFPEDRWDARAFLELLAMPGASGHLLEEAGEALPLGLILDVIVGETAEVLTLGVAPAARRQGIARSLLEDLFRRARITGASSVTLEVAADNPSAHALYLALGFESVGRRPGYYRRGNATMDALLFRRMLSP